MNLNDLFNEEKVRLDPKCWTGKKIGNPKTKMKGGTRVNNCVPAESVNEMDKSQTPPGRDGSNDSDAGKKEYTAKATTPKKVAKDGEKILNKELNKKQGVAEGSEWETKHDEFTTVGDRATPEQINKIVSALGVAAKQASSKRGFLNKIVSRQSNGDLARMAQGAETLAKNIQRNSNAKPGTDERKELGQHLVYAVSLLKRMNGQQGVAEAGLDEAHHGSLLNPKKGQFASVIFQSQWDTNPQIDYYNNLDDAKFDTENASAHHGSVYAWNGARWVRKMSATERTGGGGGYGSWEENKQGVAEEYELAGVGVAYELGRRAYKERKTARDNPYSATREARKNDEWAKGLERGKHDANAARHFRSSVREQGMAEGLAQDEAEEDSGWRAEFVNEINYNTFEVKLTNTRSKESANFIVRPVDMVSYGPTLSIETMDVHDLQTGQTESWTNDDPAPDGPIAYAISGLFYDDKQLQQKLQNIIDTHDTKGQDMMPGLEKRRSIGQEVDADAYIDSQEKTQAAMAKMKKGVAEKLGDNRPKLGSKRDAGKSIRKWRSARGLDETGVAEEAPPGDKAERMVKHIKKSYAKDGKITDKEKGIAYATAWKAHNAGKVEEAQYDRGDYYNARMAGEYGKGMSASLDGGGGDGPGRGDIHKGQTKHLPADPFGRASGDAPQSGKGKIYTKALPDEMDEGEQQKGADYRDPPEADYGDDYQDMVARVKKLAGLSPLKTVYDPAKRVYRNVPTAVQPKK